MPTLLHKHLHANAHGRVRVTLRCPATAGKRGCKEGAVTLIAKIATVGHRSSRRIRRIVAIRLARARYSPRRGEFVVVLKLNRRARTLLRRHHDRLAVQVVIQATGGGTRRVAAVLR